jgi:trigger factor
MQFNVTTTQGLERRIEFLIPHTRVAGEVDRRLRELTRTANIRGFRRGKVPLPVVKQQFGAQVQGETVDGLIRQSYSEAIDQEKLRPAGNPRIEAMQLKFGEDLKFAALIEVLPEVVVKPVDGIQIERPVAQITDADVDAMLQSMRRQRLTYQPVEREARDLDRVVVDFLGRIDGAPFEGGEAKDTPLVLGTGRAIPEFEAAVRGMSAGEKKVFPLRFPQNYGSAQVAGKDAQFEVTVKRIEAPELPPVDEAFARSLGIADGDLARMRAEVKANLEREVGARLRARTKDSVMNALLASTDFELPKALVQNDQQHLAELAREDLARRGLDAQAAQLPPEMFADQAQRRVRLGLLVGEIVKTENLQARPEQVRKAIEEIAQSYEKPAQVIQWYLGNRERLSEIEGLTLENNLVDWVLGHAKVTDAPVPFAELMGHGA